MTKPWAANMRIMAVSMTITVNSRISRMKKTVTSMLPQWVAVAFSGKTSRWCTVMQAVRSSLLRILRILVMAQL